MDKQVTQDSKIVLKKNNNELHSDSMTDQTDNEESEDSNAEELQEDECKSDNNGKNLVIIIFDLCISRLSFFL